VNITPLGVVNSFANRQIVEKNNERICQYCFETICLVFYVSGPPLFYTNVYLIIMTQTNTHFDHFDFKLLYELIQWTSDIRVEEKIKANMRQRL
jgi:hypothetical protein